MALFGKKQKKEEMEMPALPELPKLPDLPNMRDDDDVRQLPSFPSNSIGKRFSQDSIKDAVSGERGGSRFYGEEDEDEEDSNEPFRTPMTEELEEGPKMEKAMKKPEMRGQGFREEAGPVFVRIDRFEDGLRTFENIKTQISEIERMLSDTRRLKEKEEAELHSWEEELKRMKTEIEKIGADIFSKI